MNQIQHQGWGGRAIALYHDERKLFFAGMTLLSIVAMLYVYFVIASVVHVVIRKELAQETSTLASHVSELESKYIEAEHAVSEQIATQAGYSEVAQKIFIERSNETLVRTNNGGSRYR